MTNKEILGVEESLENIRMERQEEFINEYGDIIPSRLLLIGEVSKSLNMSGRALNKVLREKGIQYEDGDCWTTCKEYDWLIPEYADYEVDKYTRVLKWTEKGKEWIIDLIHNN